MTIEMINEKFGRMCRGLLKRRWIALGAFVVILFVGMIGMKKKAHSTLMRPSTVTSTLRITMQQ